jgi:hypothetical protein
VTNYYQYKLVGANEEWNAPTDQRTINSPAFNQAVILKWETLCLLLLPHRARAIPEGGPHCGFVASGEIFSIGDVNRRTLVHIAGTPISECREAA